MGNCTVAIKHRTGLTPTGQCIIADITLSNSYADGGDTIPLALLGMKSVAAVDLCSDSAVPAGGADVTGRSLVVIHGAAETTAPKIAAYVQGAGAGPLTETAAAVDLSGVTVRAIVYGDMPHV